jgi:hypothetical protein
LKHFADRQNTHFLAGALPAIGDGDPDDALEAITDGIEDARVDVGEVTNASDISLTYLITAPAPAQTKTIAKRKHTSTSGILPNPKRTRSTKETLVTIAIDDEGAVVDLADEEPDEATPPASPLSPPKNLDPPPVAPPPTNIVIAAPSSAHINQQPVVVDDGHRARTPCQIMLSSPLATPQAKLIALLEHYPEVKLLEGVPGFTSHNPTHPKVHILNARKVLRRSLCGFQGIRRGMQPTVAIFV